MTNAIAPSICKASSVYVRNWRLRNGDRSRLLAKLYGRMSRNPVFMYAWPLIVANYGGKCLCCGSEDVIPCHVVRLSMLNGAYQNNLSNLQPICRACNARHESGADYRPDRGAWIAEGFPYAISQFKDIRKMRGVPYHLFKRQPKQSP
jgi:hypothetical protein